MKQSDQSTVYDFESQLELGELLLGLGRIEDAEIELRKARELNEIGAYRTSDNDPKRQEYLQRLAIALERVESIQGRSRRNSRIWWFALTGIMGVLLTVMFVAWAFDRSSKIEMKTSMDEMMVAISTERVQIQRESTNIANERTTVAEKISKLVSEGTISGWEIQRALEVAHLSATQSAQIIATVEARDRIGGGSNSVAPIVITVIQPTYATNGNGSNSVVVVTATPQKGGPSQGTTSAESTSGSAATPTFINTNPSGDKSQFNELRVRSSLANIRWGPGFEYGVRVTLVEGNIVELTGQSQDGFWYKVVANGNVEGWMHTSLVKPVGFDQLPVFDFPTNTPAPNLTPTSGLDSSETPVVVRPTLSPDFIVTRPFVTYTPDYLAATPVPSETNTAVATTEEATVVPATAVPSATNTAVATEEATVASSTAVPSATNTAVATEQPTFVPATAVPFATNTAVATKQPTFVSATTVPSATKTWSTNTPNATKIPTTYPTNTPSWSSPTPNLVVSTVVPVATVIVTPLPTKTLEPVLINTVQPAFTPTLESKVVLSPTTTFESTPSADEMTPTPEMTDTPVVSSLGTLVAVLTKNARVAPKP